MCILDSCEEQERGKCGWSTVREERCRVIGSDTQAGPDGVDLAGSNKRL